jgi:hypothetical protein
MLRQHTWKGSARLAINSRLVLVNYKQQLIDAHLKGRETKIVSRDW